jgi:hypothetical protein
MPGVKPSGEERAKTARRLGLTVFRRSLRIDVFCNCKVQTYFKLHCNYLMRASHNDDVRVVSEEIGRKASETNNSTLPINHSRAFA